MFESTQNLPAKLLTPTQWKVAFEDATKKWAVSPPEGGDPIARFDRSLEADLFAIEMTKRSEAENRRALDAHYEVRYGRPR